MPWCSTKYNFCHLYRIFGMRNRSIGDHNEELWTLIWMYNQNYANYQEISTIFSKNVPKQCMHTCDFFWIWKWTYFGFIHSVHCKSIPEKYNFSTIVLGNEWGGVQMTIKEYFWLQNLFYKRGGGAWMTLQKYLVLQKLSIEH